MPSWRRLAVAVDLDDPALVHLDVGHVEVEVLRDGLAADRDEQRLGLQRVPTFGLSGRRVLAAVGAALALGLLLLAGVGRGYLDLDARVRLLQALRVGLGARHDVDAAVLEVLLEGLGDLRVLERHEAVQDLDDGHLGAEVVVHARELDPDGARAEDDDALRVATRCW